MSQISVAIKLLSHAEGLSIPEYQTAHAAGMDLCAAIREVVVIESGDRALIPTGIAIALPDGYEAQIRPRSGLAIKHGVTLLNSPGTIDADYRGEIKVIVINHSREPFKIERGMRIAQIVVAQVTRAQWQMADCLPESSRAAGGFGSTGT